MAELNETETLYSAAEVCELFEIARTTLLRWEDEGTVPRTQRIVRRGRVERFYRREHIERIAYVMRQRLRSEIELTTRHMPDTASPPRELLERLFLIEFLDVDKSLEALRGLKGLARQYDLRQQTIQKLIDTALRLNRGEEARRRIWQFLLDYDAPRK